MAKKIKKIAIIMAMDEEARPLLGALMLRKFEISDPCLPLRLYGGVYDKLDLHLIHTGIDERFGVDQIGPVPATLAAQHVCKEIKPDLVISAGTAGGFAKHGANIGTIVVSDKTCMFHDRHIPLPGFDDSGLGHYPVVDASTMTAEFGYHSGIVSSGSSLLKKEAELALMDKHGAMAKEMEAAAIAWVCSLYQTPFMAVKSITNLLDEPAASEEQFVANLSRASQCLSAAMIKIIPYLQGKEIVELKIR